MQFRVCASNKISIIQIILNCVRRNRQKFFTNLVLAVHLRSSLAVEELTFAVFHLLPLITQVLLDL